MLAASDLGGLIGTIFFVALLVGLKLLEVIFRKITQAKHRERLGREDVRIIEEDVPASAEAAAGRRPTAGGPYLPYEEAAEEIFGDYIKLRRRVAATAAPRPPVPAPRRRPAVEEPIPVVEIIEDAAISAAPKTAPPQRRPACAAYVAAGRSVMSAAQARRAFVASLIFGPPKSRARAAGPR